MSDSKDRSGAPPDKTFDEAWGALPGEPGAGEGGTRAWTEEVRGARKRDGDEEPTREEPPPRTEKTMAWTEEVRAERKRDAPPADDEMERLMRSAPSKSPPLEDEVKPSASTSMMSFAALELPERPKPADDVMDAMMGAEDEAPSDEESVADESQAEAEAEEDEASSEEESDADESQAEAEAEDDDKVVELPLPKDEAANTEEPPEPVLLFPEYAKPDKAPRRRKKTKSRMPLVVGGAVAAAIALWFSRGPDSKPEPSEPAPTAETPVSPTKADTKPPAPETETPETKQAPSSKPTPPPKPDPNRDPREPPPGTPPEIAAVFKKLPVSPADRAPVGGVGRSGVHIDDVGVGSGYERSRCTGGDGPFSVAEVDRANVCLRVVHQRQKEELSVVWQKKGGHARRGKIVVKPMHAYRTRAYLKLRSEYVGDWDVKVFSDDGVELASYPFSVVP